jgi:hypothetical protein
LTAKVSCSEDLFERFGLTGIARDMARVLPNGEKNSLRKGYKGYMKKLGVSGHFDINSDDTGLCQMMTWPKEEWNLSFVRTREVENGLSREARARLEKATTMRKGVITEADWEHINILQKDEKQAASARPTAPNTPATLASGVPRPKQPQQSMAQEALRPKRRGTKRAYGDSSFEGYGEGFPDDDMQGSGYSTGEGEMGAAGQKRRKKVCGQREPT